MSDKMKLILVGVVSLLVGAAGGGGFGMMQVDEVTQQLNAMTQQKDEALLRNAQIDLERYKKLVAQDSIARQQLAQRQQELNEAQARRAQAAQGYELTSKELSVTRPLISSGAVSEVELLRLERDVAGWQFEAPPGPGGADGRRPS